MSKCEEKAKAKANEKVARMKKWSAPYLKLGEYSVGEEKLETGKNISLKN